MCNFDDINVYKSRILKDDKKERMAKKKSSGKKGKGMNTRNVIIVIVIILIAAFGLAMIYQGPGEEDEEGLGAAKGSGKVRVDPDLTESINKIFGSGSADVKYVEFRAAPNKPITKITINYNIKELKAALVKAADRALREEKVPIKPTKKDKFQLKLFYNNFARIEYTNIRGEGKKTGTPVSVIVLFPKKPAVIGEILNKKFPSELIGIESASLNPARLDNIDTGEDVFGYLRPSKVIATGYKGFLGSRSFTYILPGVKEQKIKLSPVPLKTPKKPQGSGLEE